jgi:hypothetical protein
MEAYGPRSLSGGVYYFRDRRDSWSVRTKLIVPMVRIQSVALQTNPPTILAWPTLPQIEPGVAVSRSNSLGEMDY